MHRFRPKITPPLVISLLALFIAAGGGDALADIIISDNSQVAKGTIAGHNPPSGKRSNIIAGSINGKDLSDKLATNIDDASCPDNTRLALASGDLCFTELQEKATFVNALDSCAEKQLRLPTFAEQALIFENLSAEQIAVMVMSWGFVVEENTRNNVSTVHLLGNSSTRELFLAGAAPTNISEVQYYCVTDAR